MNSKRSFKRSFQTFKGKSFFSQFNNKYQSNFFSTLNSSFNKNAFSSFMFVDKMKFLVSAKYILKTFSTKNMILDGNSESCNGLMNSKELNVILGNDMLKLLSLINNSAISKYFF